MIRSFQGNSIRGGAKIKHRLSFCEQVGFECARRKVGVVGDGGRRIDKIDGGAGCVVEFLRERPVSVVTGLHVIAGELVFACDKQGIIHIVFDVRTKEHAAVYAAYF